MRVIDLTHPITPIMPVFPGTEPPQIELANTLEEDGFLEHKLTMYTHTGTHLDAPAHMLENGPTLDSLDINHFMGKAALVDVRHVKEITVEDLIESQQDLSQADFVLFYTGWSTKWGTPQYFEAAPSLTTSAANWLMQFNLKGIGTDAISIDHMDSKDFPIHHILFNKGLVVIENLTNLEQIQAKEFIFSCLPLHIQEGDGSPIRAIAILDNIPRF